MTYECRVGEFCFQISNTYKDENKIKIIKKFPDGNNKGITIQVVIINFGLKHIM